MIEREGQLGQLNLTMTGKGAESGGRETPGVTHCLAIHSLAGTCRRLAENRVCVGSPNRATNARIAKAYSAAVTIVLAARCSRSTARRRECGASR